MEDKMAAGAFGRVWNYGCDVMNDMIVFFHEKISKITTLLLKAPWMMGKLLTPKGRPSTSGEKRRKLRILIWGGGRTEFLLNGAPNLKGRTVKLYCKMFLTGDHFGFSSCHWITGSLSGNWIPSATEIHKAAGSCPFIRAFSRQVSSSGNSTYMCALY